MQNVQNINSLGKSSIVEYIFLSWLLCLPFGSMIGGLSLGFLTLYPSLVLLLILTPIGTLTFFKWNKWLKAYSIFLFMWLVIGILYPKLLGGNYTEEWKFDVRSLGLQFLVSTMLIGMYYKLGRDTFLKYIRIGVVYFLLVLLIYGLFEFFTGIHIRGQFTDRLLELDKVNELYYAPVFIYDNPNDYMVYLILVVQLLFVFYLNKKSERWKRISLLFVAFLFAFVASSRIAEFTLLLMVIFQIVPTLQFVSTEKAIKWGLPMIIILTSLLLYSNNPLFYGPKFGKGEITMDGEFSQFPKTSKKPGTLSSDQIRKNLFANGVAMIKEKPVFGLGPGGFRSRHVAGKVEQPTETVIGPHNYVIELLAGYGVIGWMMLFAYGCLFMIHVFSSYQNRQFDWLLLSIPVFGLCTLMPSNFLYMDINWIFICLILLFTIENTELSKND